MQGFSNGDVMTQAFAQSKGELLAAAGFISGPSGKEFLKDTSVVLPVIQMRGEKDVLNGGENWEENPYEVRDELNELNRSFWLKANRTCTIPEVYIWGKHNMARYTAVSYTHLAGKTIADYFFYKCNRDDDQHFSGNLDGNHFSCAKRKQSGQFYYCFF